MVYTFESHFAAQIENFIAQKTRWGLVIWSPLVSCETLTAFA